MGLDVGQMLVRTLRFMHASQSCTPAGENPGVRLGAVLGDLAQEGRDKVTFLVSESMATIGMWLEQLLAESTGKEGKGLVPIALEPVGDPSEYGNDRFFVCMQVEGEDNKFLNEHVAALKSAGHPAVEIRLRDRLDIAQEFFRWEIATATAGAVLGINPFNQPNVEESKDNTRGLLEATGQEGTMPEERPSSQQGGLSFYGPDKTGSVPDAMGDFLNGSNPGDYVALLAYLTEEESTQKRLQKIRTAIRAKLNIATTLGYGPRYLHSTGQMHKGGPETGLFVLLTADDGKDVPIPDRPYSFGILRQAQAKGDFEALRKHGRRVIRLHLGSDVAKGLGELEEIVQTALERRSS